MRDIELYLEKLHEDARNCLTISNAAATQAKRDLFKMMAGTYGKLATDLEKIIATNVAVDEERDKLLISLLHSEDRAKHLGEVAKLLGQHRSR